MPGTVTDQRHSLNVFLDRIRYVITMTGQGPCHSRYVPQLLTRLNPKLDNRSIIDVLWEDTHGYAVGEDGWKKVERIVDESVCVYQDAREGEVAPIWAGMTEPLPGPNDKEIARWAAADVLNAAQKKEAEAIRKTYGPDMPDAELEAVLAHWWSVSSANDCGHVAIAHWSGASTEARRRGWTIAGGKRKKKS